MEKQFFLKKKVAIFLLICIITAFFFSVIYIELHSSHECTGHLCSVCSNLDSACKVLEHMGMYVKSINFLSLICIVFSVYSISFSYLFIKHLTLVNLKVRLDN